MGYTTIIPTRNRPELLYRALRSVYAQSCPAAQIVIVDDGSDVPVELPRDLQDARTCILRSEVPRGGPSARNLGLARASHSYVAFLDDDDEWLPRKMELQLNHLQAHPECLLVSCGYWRAQGGATYEEVVTEDFLQQYGQYDSYIGSFSFMVLRRDDAGQFRPLDPGLPAFQDWDYYLELRNSGSIGMLAAPLGIYHAHEEARITTKGQNRLKGLRKCYFRHRKEFSGDARRWVLSRMVFDRAMRSEGAWRRIQLVALSVRAGARGRLPIGTKARALAKRLLHLAFEVSALERFRARVFGLMGKLRRVKAMPALCQPAASRARAR